MFVECSFYSLVVWDVYSVWKCFFFKWRYSVVKFWIRAFVIMVTIPPPWTCNRPSLLLVGKRVISNDLVGAASRSELIGLMM